MATNSVLDESTKAAARYHVELMAKKEAFEEAAQAKASWEQKLHCLKARRTKCSVLGIIVAVCFACLVNNDGSIISDVTVGNIVGAVFLLFWFFTIPFGLCPLVDFMRKHGFWIMTGWIFMLCLFAFVFTFALCAGPIYFVYLESKIEAAKRNIKLARQNEQAAYAEYQAF